MKILKLIKDKYGHYCVVFDKIPEITYEKIGSDFIGSYEENGNIIFSNYLKKESYGNAFAGRELKLRMKDYSIRTIKDYWFDYGSYHKHGEFINIGVKTLRPSIFS